MEHATLADMLDDLSTNIDQYFQETLKEVFERLRPRRSGLKNNSEFEIGKKVIRYSLIDSRYSTPHLSQYGEEEITGMDNVFHLLDGKGIAKYPDDAVTVIKAAMNKGNMEGETDYFYLKWFKNGNLHIAFKRSDLVAELNRRGGGNRIK